MRDANRLLQALATPFHIDDEPIYCAASIGVAVGLQGYLEAEDVLRDADLAMFQGQKPRKIAGGALSVGHARPRQDAAAHRKRLRQALLRGEFVLHYQPIVVLADQA